MTFTVDGRSMRRGRALRLALLALAGLVVGHDAVFVAQYGMGGGLAEAMSVGGHNGWWTGYSTVALAGLAMLVGRSLAELVRLALRARPTRGHERRRAATAVPYPREVLELWRALFPIVVVAFAIQENLEHLQAFGHMAGFGVLIGPDDPLALPVLAAVTFAFAAVGALIRWQIHVLEARLARASIRHPRHLVASRPHRRWAIVGALLATRWAGLRQAPGRAPPRAVLA
jgi:hypothetical protein